MKPYNYLTFSSKIRGLQAFLSLQHMNSALALLLSEIYFRINKLVFNIFQHDGWAEVLTRNELKRLNFILPATGRNAKILVIK